MIRNIFYKPETLDAIKLVFPLASFVSVLILNVKAQIHFRFCSISRASKGFVWNLSEMIEKVSQILTSILIRRQKFQSPHFLLVMYVILLTFNRVELSR